jgi:hypothetical protein
MNLRLALLFCFCSLVPCAAQTIRTQTIQQFSGGSDFVSDLAGAPDPANWGTAGYSDNVIQFNPPAGYRVRILSAQGSVSTFARGIIPPGTHAGASWGLVSTETDSSSRATNLNEHCMAYTRQSISATKDVDTTPFTFAIVNGELPADNKLISRIAVYVNGTGLVMHIEISLIITYTFEPNTAN